MHYRIYIINLKKSFSKKMFLLNNVTYRIIVY